LLQRSSQVALLLSPITKATTSWRVFRHKAPAKPTPFLALAVNEGGPQLVQFEHLLVTGCLHEEGLLQLAQDVYLFLIQPSTVVGETPKVRLRSPRKLERCCSW
jgi:hypothetical protein